MQLLSIGIDERDQNAKAALLSKAHSRKPDGLDIEEKSAGNILFLNYVSRQQHDETALKEISNRLHEYIADSISEFIMEDMQSQLVEKIIRDEYFYFSQEEKNKILRDAMAIMWGGNPTVRSEVIRNRWRGRVWKRLMEHLQTNNELVLEGFIRFRLKDFLSELEEAVDRAVDDLLIEKEYTEFIKLLRYFVEIQEPKVDEVHVVMGDDKKYTLLDSSLRVINNDILEDLAKEISDKEISYDDLLISSLITIAPRKITIHQFDKIKNTELLNTINNVFSGRVTMSKDSVIPRKY
ncbi:MAG TPA: putative sporulation protein YtxC [Candidatus Atribacteria bacterium]|nr:putative sporulation protein YtxC [Candidatus Atribacteria bacterium]HPT78838.1 putative sporulation protein YtxC [Candidatus Atribacteria bacterium]